MNRMAQIYLSEKRKKIIDIQLLSTRWMFWDINLDHKINRLHKRALRIAYNNNASFEELIEKDGSVNIHQRILRCLATEMFKIRNKLSLLIICDLANESNIPHHTRCGILYWSCIQYYWNRGWKSCFKKSAFAYICSKIWSSFTDDLTSAKTLIFF